MEQAYKDQFARNYDMLMGYLALACISAVNNVYKPPVQRTSDYNAAKAANWKKPDGSTWWPDNDGFAGKPSNQTLQPGTRIDRYGSEKGYYLSPEGTPYASRALEPGSSTKPYYVYEIVKPVNVQAGTVTPWFDQPGGGMQYKFFQSIEELIASGILRRITG